MDPNCAISISGRIIAEFEDDASGFLTGEPEFVPLTPEARVVEQLQTVADHLTPPSEVGHRRVSDP